jgi:hypothetical protein
MTKKADKRVVAYLTQDQKDFLNFVIAESETATSNSTAIQWCIDACQAIEDKYERDALSVGLNDVRDELNKWKAEQIKVWAPIFEFMHENGFKLGMKVGESMTDKVLEILKEKVK